MELIVIGAVLFLVLRRLSRRDVVADSAATVGPVGWSSDIDWRVVRPLGRADLKRVLRHPAFIAGVLMTPLMLMAATADKNDWRGISVDTALALVPLGWMTIIATNLVALRPKRTGADELFSVLPAPQPVRTTALLATMFGPVAIAAVLATGWTALLGTRRTGLGGSPEWSETVVGLLIVAGSVCVGVAVARWLPKPGFGLLAVIATIVLQARFLDVKTWPWNRGSGDPMRFIGFIAETADVSAEFLELRPSGWHLLYLVGLVVAVAGVALARDGIPRPVTAVLGVGVVVAAGAGWMQTRPLSSAQEDTMVLSLSDPLAHQICEESGGVRYCAYPEFAADVPEWRDRVDTVLTMLPTTAIDDRGPLEVIQRPATIVGDSNCQPAAFKDALPPSVAKRLSTSELWPADNHVHPPFGQETFPCSDRDVDGFFLAVQAGAWATGLPPAPHGDNEHCTASGQARAVIALWAGAAASTDGARTLRDIADEGAIDGATLITFPEWDSPPMWGVDYAVADAEIALAMLQMPADDVRTALERAWTHWTNPHTTTSMLVDEFGIAQPTAQATPASADCP